MTHSVKQEATARTRGALGQFADPNDLLRAAGRVRDEGFRRFDCHSPFPIHGMDQAMGLGRSMLGWVVGLMALLGGGLGVGLQWWSHSVAYPLVISGKPFFSFQAYVPVTFGLAVLFSAAGAILGMFHFNRLPRLHHPVFYSENFREFSTGGFFISIESEDSRFDPERTPEFLRSIGASNVELLEG